MKTNSTARPLTLEEAIHLQALEGNPLTVEEIEMFRMFDREDWPEERRLAHIRESIRRNIAAVAAE